MSTDNTPMLMYGMEFSSFAQAMNFLFDNNKISKENYKIALYNIEFSINDIEWTRENYWSPDGILGHHINPQILLIPEGRYEGKSMQDIITHTDNIIGEDCDIHLFVATF